MEELGLNVPEVELGTFNRKRWNLTNVMNTKCLLIQLERLPELENKPKKSKY